MTAPYGKQLPSGKKFCVACKEPIPADATVCWHCHTAQTPEKTSWGSTGLKWIGGITAVIGLITALSTVIGPVKGWWTQGRDAKTMLATALKQEELGEYSAAFDTLSEILKNSPNHAAALHARLDVTMLWIEDTWAPRHDSEEFDKQARVLFQRATPVLQAGLGGASDYREADVLAHLGWLNLLKWKVIQEDGITQGHFEAALKIDPANAYANAMLGDLVLETQGSLDEAKAHFATALKNDKVKPFVRSCQLQAMIYNDSAGVRAELIRVASEMRKNGEALGEGNRHRIHSYYEPVVTSDAELREALTALPAEDAWATFIWLDQAPDSPSGDPVLREFIRAELDEISGKRSQALQEFRQLQQETQKLKLNGTLSDRVGTAVKRLSR